MEGGPRITDLPLYSHCGAGAVVQNKAGAYTQLQEGSNQNKPVTGTGLRVLLTERPGSFAAAPYLLRRCLHMHACPPMLAACKKMIHSESTVVKPC